MLSRLITMAMALPMIAYAAEPAGLYGRNNADAVFSRIVMARTRLESYDYLLSTYMDDPVRGWQLPALLNEMRGDIIDDAIAVFYMNGYTFLPEDPKEMREILFINRDQASWGQAPASLDDLVRFNYLDHIPVSPYPGAAIVSEPARNLPPGTILYRPVATELAYTREPGALEFYILAVIGTREEGTLPEVVETLFRGDIYGLVEVIPENIVSCHGFYPRSDSKYAKQVKELRELRAKTVTEVQ